MRLDVFKTFASSLLHEKKKKTATVLMEQTGQSTGQALLLYCLYCLTVIWHKC